MNDLNKKQLVVLRDMLFEIWDTTDNSMRKMKVESLLIRLEVWINEVLGKER